MHWSSDYKVLVGAKLNTVIHDPTTNNRMNPVGNHYLGLGDTLQQFKHPTVLTKNNIIFNLIFKIYIISYTDNPLAQLVVGSLNISNQGQQLRQPKTSY